MIQSLFSPRYLLRRALIGTAIFLVVALPAACQSLFPGDAWGYHVAQGSQSPLLTSFFRAMTTAGSFRVLVPVGVGVLLWKLRQPRLLLFLGLYTLGVSGLEGSAKRLVARPRPHDYLSHGLSGHTSHGFPSGHVLAATAFYMLLLVLLHTRVRHSGWRVVLNGSVLLLLFFIGLSRVYLGAHWPSDVVGGYALGASYCWAATMIYDWWEERHGARETQPGVFLLMKKGIE